MQPGEMVAFLGDEPTVTFGIRPLPNGVGEGEVVGPLKPQLVQYGRKATKHGSSPLVFFNFNKYRPDLPPWHDVDEFVMANVVDGQTMEYTFHGAVAVEGVHTSGRLKTVTMSASDVSEGVVAEVASRDAVRGRDDG